MVAFLIASQFTSLYSQVINGRQYNYVGNWYNWQGGKFINNLNLPKLAASNGRDTGAIYYRIADSSIYLWTGFAWRQVTGSGGGAADSSIFATRYYTGQTYVPYNGAIDDVDLGTFSLNTRHMNITGTNGTGFIHLRHQSTLPNATGQSTAIYADDDGNLGYKNDGLSRVTFNTRFNTADRIYRFQNKSYTVADSADVALKVNLSDTASMLSPYLRSNVAAATYVPQTRTISINGTTQDLSDNRSWTISGTNIYNTSDSLTGNRFVNLGTNKTLSFGRGLNTNFHLFNNGNAWFGNGTPIDAGFRLDVNGNARFSSDVVARSGFLTSSISSGSGTGLLIDWLGTNGRITGYNWSNNSFFPIHIDRSRLIIGNSSIGSRTETLVVRGTSFFEGSVTFTGTELRLGVESANNVFSSVGTYSNVNYPAIIDTSVGIIGGSAFPSAARRPVFLIGSQIRFQSGNNLVGQFAPTSGNLILQDGGTFTDVPSARLQVNSTTQGFLPPRMTTAQRDAIVSPAAGLFIYNTTTNKHQGYNGTTWNDFY